MTTLSLGAAHVRPMAEITPNSAILLWYVLGAALAILAVVGLRL